MAAQPTFSDFLGGLLPDPVYISANFSISMFLCLTRLGYTSGWWISVRGHQWARLRPQANPFTPYPRGYETRTPGGTRIDSEVIKNA